MKNFFARVGLKLYQNNHHLIGQMQPGANLGLKNPAILRLYQGSDIFPNTQTPPEQTLQQDPSKVSNSKKFSNALVFLDHIKKKLEDEPGLYREFLHVMSEFKSQTYLIFSR